MKKFIQYLGVFGFSALTLIACKKDEIVTVDEGVLADVVTIDENTTNLSGPMKGVLKSGTTYILTGDLIIPEGEEIVAEECVTIIAQGDGGPIGPEITVHGSLISLGTEQCPNLFSVPVNQRTEANIFAGLWGGIQCSEDADLVYLKWTRMEYLGGEGGPGTPRAGKIRYGLWTLSSDTEIVLEDCHFYGSKDDVYRPVGGKINLVRNTFEFCGETGGDGLNVKAGTIGNIAYNVFYGSATNAFKPSNEGDGTVQTNIMVYNNTIINGGWRRPGMSRGANINFEVGARGGAFNNIIVNCKRGIRVLEDADVPNISVDNNLYYATHQEMVDEFIPTDAETSTLSTLGSNNIYGQINENNPMFANYDVDQFTYAQYEAGEAQPTNMNQNSGANLRLQAGSPAVGAGTTSFTPVSVNWVHATGDRAPSVIQPSMDLGAYPMNGSGNNHY
ncbi:hypothetical protein [Brumimicrobium mesophilum]|uniref:hypothetical protein n=1 Tax=Brumimicrobium mesophilum TaxID=392717 RepID=UPI000D142AC3|nr:hypothetical protein [Brumimicrobium mesophilum]